MDKCCGRSSMRPMITVAIATRLIWGLSLENTQALNASWICPLLGIILFLPIALAINSLSRQPTGCAFNGPFLKKHRSAVIIISVSVYLLLIMDASSTTHLLTNTADVMVLGEAPVWLLALPLGLLIFLCGIFGMEAEGRSARIWLKISLTLLVIVVFVQFRNYKIEWLTPLFGGGLKAIMRGGIYCAGYIALLSIPWLIAVEDTEHSGVIPGAITGAVSASAILALLAMLMPPLTRTSVSRSGHIEMILSNGRVHLMLQLVMVILWFANLLHLLNVESTAASAFFQKAFPAASVKIIAGITTISVYLYTVSGAVTKKPVAKLYSEALYPVLCFLVLVWLLFEHLAKRRMEHAQRY